MTNWLIDWYNSALSLNFPGCSKNESGTSLKRHALVFHGKSNLKQWLIGQLIDRMGDLLFD